MCGSLQRGPFKLCVICTVYMYISKCMHALIHDLVYVGVGGISVQLGSASLMKAMHAV